MKGQSHRVAIVINPNLHCIRSNLEATGDTLGEIQDFLPVDETDASGWIENEDDVG